MAAGRRRPTELAIWAMELAISVGELAISADELAVSGELTISGALVIRSGMRSLAME